MAKVGFWLQGATGKLAGSKLQGGVNGTIIADNTKKPKNPRTVNQTLQRVLVNTVAQGYSKLQPICFHAFEGITEGAKSMARFQKMNLEYFRERAAEIGEEQLSAYVNFVPVGQKGIRPAAFIVADGSLPRISMNINSSFRALLPMTANTYADIISKYDLQRGDQLTFVAVVESTNYPGTYQAKFARVILDPRNADGTQAALSSAFIENNAINLPNSKNNGNFGLLAYNNGMEFNFKANEKVCSIACIVSREVNKEWKRSFAQMTVSEAAIEGYSISLSRAIRLSLEGDNLSLASGNQYLNNAGVGGTQSTTSGSGSSEEEIVDEGPSFPSNNIEFNGNGSWVTSSVAGGNVAVTAPLLNIQIPVANASADNIKVTNAIGNEIGTKELTTNGDAILWEAPNGGIAAGNTLTVKKVIDGTETTWFTVSVQAADDDDASES